MAQAENRGLARVLQAIDERWWLRHGLFWLVNAGVMTCILRCCVNMPPWRIALRDALAGLPPQLLTVYPLLYGVLPRLWQGGPRRAHVGWWLAGWLAGWLGLSLGLTFAYRFWVWLPLHTDAPPFPMYRLVFYTDTFFLLLAVAGVAASLRLSRHWWREELANLRLTRENYQAELQLLKAQVHPHFLFNTLNSLYALTLRQSDQAPAVVARLTGLLQAVLRQSTAPLVPLADEVALLRNFIALEKLRYGHRLTVEFDAGAVPLAGRLAPLLLLPLVENAFKHGAAEQLGRAHIRIALAAEGTTFTCLIANSKNAEDAPVPGPAGIGLRNVRQRLQLLYPHRHRLEIQAQPDTYTVRLALPLVVAAEAIASVAALPRAKARPATSHPLVLPAHEYAA